MRKKESPKHQLKLRVPEHTQICQFVTASGTFRDGDLILNQHGLRIISQDASSSAVSDTFDTPYILDDLEMVRVIGKGGGGIVQLVRHKWTGQFFALKLIQMNIQEEVRKQIVCELKINLASQSPFIVVCYRAFYANGVISLLLEFMDGGSLANVMKSFKRIPEIHLAVICRQVLKGLVYLHQERHIIHRDIKPSNLLVNHKGEVKISDFGVSAILSGSKSLRKTFVGTYSYMSPERISGDTYGYDSDIWSLGLAILECALGHFPYFPPGKDADEQSYFEILQTIVNMPVPCAPLDQFSPEFSSFISECIQKEPKGRPSALQLLNHLFITMHDSRSTIHLATFLQNWSPLSC